MENLAESNEDFGKRMARMMKEAQENYERMSPEEQGFLDEAAQRLGERVRSEIMASFPISFEDDDIKINPKEVDHY